MRREAPFLLLLLPALLACYAPGFLAPPAYDDVTTILQNPKMLDDGALLRSFADPTERTPQSLSSRCYRPLTEWTLGINLRLAHGSIMGLRIGNLLIHAVSALLAFALVRRLAGEGTARWAVVFFALHPLGVQAVTYVSQRATALEAALLFLVALLYRKHRLGWALACAFLSIGAKETAVTLPLVLGAMEWILRDPKESPRARLRRWLPFLLPPAVLVMQVLRGAAAEIKATGVDLLGESGMHPLAYLGHELPVLWHYARMAFWPFPMRFCYDRALPGQFPSAWVLMASGAGLLALLGWILLGPDRHRTARLGAALFLAPLALESSVFPRAETAWGYRCYPGLLGAGILFAALPRFAKLPVLILLGAITAGENRTWASPAALLGRDVRHATHKAEIWGAYALNRLEAGRPERAERLARTACRLPWQDYRLLAARTQALLDLGRTREARAAAEAMRRAFPERTATLWLLIQGAERTGNAAALEALEREIGMMPSPDPLPLFWAVRRATARGRWREAEALLRRREAALIMYPAFWDHLGQVLLGLKRDGDAEDAYRKALTLEADLPKARNNLGLILYRRGDRAGAEAEFREALRIQPDYPLARRNLDALLARP